MIEIDLQYLEEHFDEVMDQVEKGQGYLLRTLDGEGIVILPKKDEKVKNIFKKMENEGLIKKFK